MIGHRFIRWISYWAWKDWIENPHAIHVHYKRKGIQWEVWPEDRLHTLQLEADEYHDLLFLVQTKFPNESRFETAARYIQEKESE